MIMGFDPNDHHRLRYVFMNWLVKRTVRNEDILVDIGTVDGGRLYAYINLCRYNESGVARNDRCMIAKAIGIDISKENLNRRVTLYANSLYSYKGYIYFVRCDWDKIPFKDNSIDVVVYDNGLEHSINCEKTINEIWRVCKREAIFGVPHAPDMAVKLGYYGHLHEFSHDELIEMVGEKFYVLESYYLKHGYGGYNYAVVRGIKNLDLIGDEGIKW